MSARFAQRAFYLNLRVLAFEYNIVFEHLEIFEVLFVVFDDVNVLFSVDLVYSAEIVCLGT